MIPGTLTGSGAHPRFSEQETSPATHSFPQKNEEQLLSPLELLRRRLQGVTLPECALDLLTPSSDGLKEILATKIKRKDPHSLIHYKTTLEELLREIAPDCSQILLRGSATLKLIGYEALEKALNLQELPEDVVEAVKRQLDAPLNDIDLHLILPEKEPLFLFNLRDRITRHLSERNAYTKCENFAQTVFERLREEKPRFYSRLTLADELGRIWIQEHGLLDFKRWVSDFKNRFEIITLPAGVDIVTIAEIERPGGVFAQDVALDIKPYLVGESVHPVTHYGAGLAAVVDLFQRSLRPGHRDNIQPGDLARALYYVIRGFDFESEEFQKKLVESALSSGFERSLNLIKKRHFKHCPRAIKIYHLQVLITLFESGYSCTLPTPFDKEIQELGFPEFYKRLAMAALIGYASGAEGCRRTTLGVEETLYLRIEMEGVSLLIKAPETLAEPLDWAATALGAPRILPPKFAALFEEASCERLRACYELSMGQAGPGSSTLPLKILENPGLDRSWLPYSWLNPSTPLTVLISLVEANRPEALGWASKYLSKGDKGHFLNFLQKKNRTLALRFFHAELKEETPQAFCKAVIRTAAFVCARGEGEAENLRDTLLSRFLETAPELQIPSGQEGNVCTLLGAYEGNEKFKALCILSRFRFESGFEFAQSAVSILEAQDPEGRPDHLIEVWERLVKVNLPIPQSVKKARLYLLKGRFDAAPADVYRREIAGSTLDPALKARFLSALVSKASPNEALEFLLEYATVAQIPEEKRRSVVTRVLKEATPSIKLCEIIRQCPFSEEAPLMTLRARLLRECGGSSLEKLELLQQMVSRNLESEELLALAGELNPEPSQVDLNYLLAECRKRQNKALALKLLAEREGWVQSKLSEENFAYVENLATSPLAKALMHNMRWKEVTCRSRQLQLASRFTSEKEHQGYWIQAFISLSDTLEDLEELRTLLKNVKGSEKVALIQAVYDKLTDLQKKQEWFASYSDYALSLNLLKEHRRQTLSSLQAASLDVHDLQTVLSWMGTDRMMPLRIQLLQRAAKLSNTKLMRAAYSQFSDAGGLSEGFGPHLLPYAVLMEERDLEQIFEQLIPAAMSSAPLDNDECAQLMPFLRVSNKVSDERFYAFYVRFFPNLRALIPEEKAAEALLCSIVRLMSSNSAPLFERGFFDLVDLLKERNKLLNQVANSDRNRQAEIAEYLGQNGINVQEVSLAIIHDDTPFEKQVDRALKWTLESPRMTERCSDGRTYLHILAAMIQAHLCYKDILMTLFLRLSKCASDESDRFLIEIFEHFLELFKLSKAEQIQAQLPTVRKVMLAHLRRAVKNRNPFFIDKYIFFAAEDEFFKVLGPEKKARHCSEHSAEYAHILHGLIATCDSAILSKVLTILNTSEMRRALQPQHMRALRIHVGLIAAGKEGKADLIGTALKEYVRLLSDKLQIPAETNIGRHAVEIAIPYAMETMDFNLLGSFLEQTWSKTSPELKEIAETVRRILNHKDFRKLVSFGDPEKLVDRVVPVCVAVLKGSGDPNALTLAKDLLLLTLLASPARGGWNRHVKAIKEALPPPQPSHDRAFVEMFAEADFSKAPLCVESQMRVGATILSKLMGAVATVGISHTLVRLGINRSYFQVQYGSAYEIFLGFMKFRFNQEFGFRISKYDEENLFFAIVEEINLIAKSLEHSPYVVMANLCLILEEISKSSFDGKSVQEEDKPYEGILITTPYLFVIWNLILIKLKEAGYPQANTLITAYTRCMLDDHLLDLEDLPQSPNDLFPYHLLGPLGMLNKEVPEDLVCMRELLKIYGAAKDPHGWIAQVIELSRDFIDT